MGVRTRSATAVTALMIALVVTIGLGAGPAAAVPSASRVAVADAVTRILAETNALRAAGGLAPLVNNPALQSVAQNWTAQQGAAGVMSHNPNYSSQIPAGWTNAAENVAKDYTYATVVEGWHGSPGHYANIMGPYTDIGIGYVESGGHRYFTQVFARYPATASPPVALAPPTSSPDGSVEVYRFWSPRYSTHFYTASLAERDSIIASFARSTWTYEGVAYRAFTTQVDGTIPLYRFWSPRLNGHFFTASIDERNATIANFPASTWTYEGVAYYVYPGDTPVEGTVAVSRFWSPRNQHHFYTASVAEKNSVITGYPASVWTYEGDTFRVPAP